MIKKLQNLAVLPLLMLLLSPVARATTEKDMSINVSWAIELITEDGIDVNAMPNAYEQFIMDLVVQLDTQHLEQLEQLAAQGNDDALTLMGLVYSLPNEAGQAKLLSNLVVVPSPRMQNYVENFELPVTTLVEQDAALAISYLEKAADQKNTLAETLLAETLMQKEGGKPDFGLCRDYFHRAALKGHTRAQVGLLQVSAILDEDIDPLIMRQIFSEMSGQ